MNTTFFKNSLSYSKTNLHFFKVHNKFTLKQLKNMRFNRNFQLFKTIRILSLEFTLRECVCVFSLVVIQNYNISYFIKRK